MSGIPPQGLEDPLTGCWLWAGGVDSKGYGRHGHVVWHRFYWEQVRGVIPYRLELDHLCRRRLCYRPEHLEIVTRRENMLRINPRHRAKIVVCQERHDLVEHGIVTPEGGRVCALCCGIERIVECQT